MIDRRRFLHSSGLSAVSVALAGQRYVTAGERLRITDVSVQLVQSDCGRKWTHVRIHTDQGITGIGEATYSHKEPVVAKMVEALKPHILGRDAFDIEGIYRLLYTGGRTAYRTGGVKRHQRNRSSALGPQRQGIERSRLRLARRTSFFLGAGLLPLWRSGQRDSDR